jgi:hypothetical protein
MWKLTPLPKVTEREKGIINERAPWLLEVERLETIAASGRLQKGVFSLANQV